MTLDEFIAAERQRPFVWGSTDCATTVDRWIEVVRGVSPLASTIGRYSDEAGAEAIKAREQNFLFAVLKVIRAFGLQETQAPAPGDIGIVVLGPKRAAMAIRVEGGWFTRDDDGVVEPPADARFIKAWKA